jgi:hypothetical protein
MFLVTVFTGGEKVVDYTFFVKESLFVRGGMAPFLVRKVGKRRGLGPLLRLSKCPDPVLRFIRVINRVILIIY